MMRWGWIALLLPVFPAYALNITIVQPATPSVAFQLVSSTPYDREEVSAPSQYILRFSQPIKPDRSYVRVYDMYGTQVNSDRLTSPDGLSLITELPALTPGRYTVKWQTRCRCQGEQTLGENFRFVVK